MKIIDYNRKELRKQKLVPKGIIKSTKLLDNLINVGIAKINGKDMALENDVLDTYYPDKHIALIHSYFPMDKIKDRYYQFYQDTENIYMTKISKKLYDDSVKEYNKKKMKK